MNLDGMLKIFDAVMTVREATRREPARPSGDDRQDEAAGGLAQTPSSKIADQIEMKLANVVVAALKEAFDRDHARLELERSHIEDQRRRAEEAARMEHQRQMIDREVGRLRLLSGAALAGWVASIALLAARLGDVSRPSQIILVAGWVLLLASLGSAFGAQTALNARTSPPDPPAPVGVAGTAALWLLIAGLALAALSLLF